MRAFRLAVLVLLVSTLYFTIATASCTASWTCPNGSSLFCQLQGSGYCYSGPNYVTCGSQTYTCAPSEVCRAAITCPDGTELYCEGSPGSCYQEWCLIVCDGVQQNCPGYYYDQCP